MTYIEWFHSQLERHQQTKAQFVTDSGISGSTIKPENLRRAIPRMSTIIIMCEVFNKWSGGDVAGLNELIIEALHTVPEYKFAINRINKGK